MAEYILSKYKKNYEAYDWLRVMEKEAKGCAHLNALSKNDRTCYLDLCKVTTSQEFKNDPTGYILSGTTNGLFVVVLQGASGGRSHTFRINSGLKVIYDYMETHELKPNKQNISKCCGKNCEFVKCCVAAELRSNKLHEKNLKME